MTREEVKMAFREAIASEYDPVLAKYEGENTAFSQEFLDKMDRLIRKNKNPLWHLVNTAAKRSLLVLTIVLLILSSVGSIPSVKAHTTEFLKRVFPAFFELNHSPDGIGGEIIFYEITDLPDGYQETSRLLNSNSTRCKVEYTNAAGDLLSLDQWSSNGALSLTYDNEHGTLSEILLDGKPAQLYKRDSVLFLSWLEDDLAITLSSYGGLTEEEFLKIAISLEKAEQ